MMTLLSLKQFDELFPTEDACIRFLAVRGAFYDSIPCPGCDRPMKQLLERQVFRCQTTRCKRRELSIRKHSFFFGSRLKCRDILKLALLWLSGSSVMTTISLTGHGSQLVCEFYNHFRQLVSSDLSLEEQTIGGVGVEVEVDETKLGKVKYHRGHRVEGVWVLVGIERTPAKRIFLTPVEKRDSETLIGKIRQHVLPGSIVITDCWRGYSGLQNDQNFAHMTVNHSLTFKDPLTGACTNTAEGLNSGLKRKIPIRNRVRDGIEAHLAEYIWRRQNANSLFFSLIDAMKITHYQ